MKKNILMMCALVCAICWQCNKSNDVAPSGSSQNVGLNTSLNESLNSSVARFNYALVKISETQGYKILNAQNASGSQTMSTVASTYIDSITLDKIAGTYTFQADSVKARGNIFSKLFTKTGSSTQFVISLPQAFILSPRSLRNLSKIDSATKNDFTITASDYHNFWANASLYDYKLSASFTLASAPIGNLNILSTSNSSSYGYTTNYSFANGYILNVNGSSGDTLNSSISLSSDTSTVFKESVSFLNNGRFRSTETKYSLLIGNVEIRRTVGIDSIQVFLNGVLQNKAAVKIIDKGTGGSITNHRDIQLTFNNGTTTNLSTLVNPSITILNNLVLSLSNMYLAANIVDYLAYNIYTGQ
jgi:hypothetical protein